MEKINEHQLLIFGFNITRWPKWAVLILGACGIFISFVLQGTSQEALYSKYHYKETIFFTFVQFLGYFSMTIPYFIRLVRGKEKLKASIPYYTLVSFSLCCSMGLSNLSVERLTYSTAVLFKSSKLIPVMIGGFMFLKKRYNIFEIMSVLLIVFGLIGISMSDKKSNNKFDTIGVLLSVASLMFDAVASNLQEKALDTYGASQTEVISVMYFIGMVMLLTLAIVTGQFYRGVSQCFQHPDMIAYLSLFGFLGSIGVQFVYLIMKAFGSLVTVMVTSCRKAMTVSLSFILFPDKKFTKYHFFSIIMIASGIALNYYGKSKNKKKKVSSEANDKIFNVDRDNTNNLQKPTNNPNHDV